VLCDFRIKDVQLMGLGYKIICGKKFVDIASYGEYILFKGIMLCEELK